MCLEQNKLCLVTSSPDGTLEVIAVILHYCNILDKAQWFIPSPQCFWRLFPSQWKLSWPCCLWPLGPLWAPVEAPNIPAPVAAPNLAQGLACTLRSGSTFWFDPADVGHHFSFSPGCLLPPSLLQLCLFSLLTGASPTLQLDPCDPPSREMALLNPLFAKWTEIQSLHCTLEPKDYRNTTERYCFPPLLLLCRLKPSVQWIMCWLTPKNPSWVGATCARRA